MKSDRLLRVGYSSLGLLAGDAALLFLLLFKAVSAGLQQHEHLMALLLRSTLEWFSLVAIVSIVGWLVIGVPAVLMISTRRILRTSWWLILLLGALLGPIAMLIVFLLLSRGKLNGAAIDHTGVLWACACLISTVAFGVHCALVRRSAPGPPGE